MSAYTLLDLSKHNNQLSVKTLLWVMSRIDYAKLAYRVEYARQRPTDKVKCVLIEYNYTNKHDVLTGYENIVEYVPATNVLVEHALAKLDFIRLMHKMLSGGNTKLVLYTRKKIVNNVIDHHRKQLVLEIQPWAFVRPHMSPEELDTEEDNMEY